MQVRCRSFWSVGASLPSGLASPRRRLVAIAVLGVASLAACGDSGDSSGNASTSSAVLSESTVATTASPATPRTTVSDVPTSPAGTEPAVETTESPTTLVVPPSEVDVVTGGYEPTGAAPQLVGGATDPIEVPLPDGVYWSWDYASDGDSVEFVLSQLFTGDACREQFGDSPEACASDNSTLYEPSATITMPAGTASVTVLASNAEAGFERFAIDATEFTHLVAGEAPAPDAPAGFAFEAYGVIVTVSGGEVTAVDQVFIS
jgi:hypothetical protein